MIVFNGDIVFSEKALRAFNESLYLFIEPVIDLMDIFHLNPNNYAEMVAELGDYFPDYIIRENAKKCIDTLLDLASWTQDNFLHKMDVLHEYALYKILLYECAYFEEMGEEGSEMLKMRFSHSGIEEVPESEREFFEDMAEFGFDSITDCIYRDVDFLSVDYISSWELTNSPLRHMFGADIDHLYPLFPQDVRKQIDEIRNNNDVFKILSAVQTVLESLEGKPALLEEKSEEEINAQIAMGLNFALAPKGLGVSQETPFGYSPLGTGEVDFYIFESDFHPFPKAIGESKMWGRFHTQVDQLMGYMHEDIDLGFTITINKSHKLSMISEKQKAILDTYSIDSQDFRMLDIRKSIFGGWICYQQHPENDQPFITNHFVLNLYRPSRKKAAVSRRKKQ
ncbi:hypothetical protein [Eggerthella sp. YY7918]|uniref:hypothetical protein n=1 Tax=Eggerthella sp. (strain YY7918) TaxID=502558 RepID=UPI000217125D|nr:hypothetical protein [Eggerthella sp. YY7918]BAK44742.1 trypsin-like serine protease [Eggerthella sp. YY7918]